jgi:hypothetical protein
LWDVEGAPGAHLPLALPQGAPGSAGAENERREDMHRTGQRHDRDGGIDFARRSIMDDQVSQFRTHARRSRELAKLAKSERERVLYEAVAGHWEALAEYWPQLERLRRDGDR